MRIHPPAALIGALFVGGMGLLALHLANGPAESSEDRAIALAMKELEREIAETKRERAETLDRAEAALRMARASGDLDAIQKAKKRLEAVREMAVLAEELRRQRRRKACASRLGPRSNATERRVWQACLSGESDE